MLEDYSANITTAAKSKKVEAEAKLAKSWRSDEMDVHWRNRTCNYALKLIADRCRNDQGGNHFIDDMNAAKVAK